MHDRAVIALDYEATKETKSTGALSVPSLPDALDVEAKKKERKKITAATGALDGVLACHRRE